MNAVGERPGSGPEWRKLDPQVRKMWFVTAFTYPLIGALILGLPGFFIVREVAEDRKNLAWMGQYAWAAPVLVYVVPVLVSLLTLGLRYGAWRYRVTDNDVATRHGVIYRRRLYVGRNRIQHVDVNAGPVERLFGLTELTVHTAGGHALSVPGLTEPEAERIRHTLMRSEVVAAPKPPLSAPPAIEGETPAP